MIKKIYTKKQRFVIIIQCVILILVAFYLINFYVIKTPKFSYENDKNAPNTSVIKYDDNLYIKGQLNITINYSVLKSKKKIGYLNSDFWGSIFWGFVSLEMYADDYNKEFIQQRHNFYYKYTMINTNTIIDLYDKPITMIDNLRSNKNLTLDNVITFNNLIDKELDIKVKVADELPFDIYVQEELSFVEDIHFYDCVYSVDGEIYLEKFSVEDYRNHIYSVKSEYYYLFEVD